MSETLLWLIFGALVVIAVLLANLASKVDRIYFSLGHLRDNQKAFAEWIANNIHRR